MNINPKRAAREQTPQGQRKVFERNLDNLYSTARAGRNEFAIGSPEYKNYRAYMQTLPKERDLLAQGLASGNYAMPKLAAYNPSTTYVRPEKIDPDKVLMKKGGVVKAKKMSSGGAATKTSSASNRGNGIAQRGKTRGKTY